MKKICGFNNYYVNHLGDVYSTKRGHCKKLKYRITKTGYARVVLYLGDKCYGKAVHRLVSQAYDPKYREDLQVNHINGIKTDNRLENLEMVTARDNQIHAYATGLKVGNVGIKHPNCKLSESDIFNIRKELLYNTQQQIADKYGVSPITINDIHTKRTWKHL